MLDKDSIAGQLADLGRDATAASKVLAQGADLPPSRLAEGFLAAERLQLGLAKLSRALGLNPKGNRQP